MSLFFPSSAPSVGAFQAPDKRMTRAWRSTQDCDLCLSSLRDGDVHTLLCGHVFHQSCVDEMQERDMDRCPSCRAPFHEDGNNNEAGAEIAPATPRQRRDNTLLDEPPPPLQDGMPDDDDIPFAPRDEALAEAAGSGSDEDAR